MLDNRVSCSESEDRNYSEMMNEEEQCQMPINIDGHPRRRLQPNQTLCPARRLSVCTFRIRRRTVATLDQISTINK